MHLYLVHHADAVGADVDPRRPLSVAGQATADRAASFAAAYGAVPDVIWHSGKLRAKETAERFWRKCNPLAKCVATRDLQPDDSPMWMRDRLRCEGRHILIAGHFPHLAGLLTLLVADRAVVFPPHGVVALSTTDEGETWRELWRIE